MSIGAGALAVRRVRVLRSPLETKFTWIVEKLKKHTISPVDIDEAKEHSSGWCHPFTGEASLGNADKLVFDNVFVFGLRSDSKRIPGTLFRLQLKAALESLERKAGGRGKSQLSKKAKDAVKDRIRAELLRRTLPSIRLVEVLWHLQSNEIWILSTSSSVLDDFEKHFNETFALPFVHLNAGTAALDFDKLEAGDKPEEARLKRYLDLAPQALIDAEGVEHNATETIEAPF